MNLSYPLDIKIIMRCAKSVIIIYDATALIPSYETVSVRITLKNHNN